MSHLFTGGVEDLADNYSTASFQVIKDLQAKVSKLEAENRSLLQMLEQNTPSLIDAKDLGFGINNQELICETQIHLLKEAAVTRVLTMEEVKKLEVLSGVLSKVKTAKPDPDALKVEKLSDDDLIKFVNQG